mmetsp:Transcript_42334/g.78872  ORF Transcript_42334/g.78872 Transcript_42334/m.78872 type:complete len:85 (+) Transcript_42334:74-328(+)
MGSMYQEDFTNRCTSRNRRIPTSFQLSEDPETTRRQMLQLKALGLEPPRFRRPHRPAQAQTHPSAADVPPVRRISVSEDPACRQ